MALYKNCRELLYHNFNEIQLTGDLSYLIKDNEEHTEDELTEHWENIVEEYLEISNNFEQKKFFRDRAELKALELKLSILQTIQYITKLGLNKEQEKQIEVILKRYRVFNLDQDILGTKDDINIKIKKFKNAFDGNEGVSFDEILSSLRINGISVSRKELTVSEYVSLLKEIKKKPTKKEK